MDCCILAFAFLYHCAKSHSRINITIKCTSCPTECLQCICWMMQCLYLPQLHLVPCHHRKILCSCWCPIHFWWVCACYLYYLLIDLTPSCIGCMYCACNTHRLIWHQAAMFVRTCIDVMKAHRKALRKVHDIWNCGPAFLCILLQPSRAWCNKCFMFLSPTLWICCWQEVPHITGLSGCLLTFVPAQVFFLELCFADLHHFIQV